MKLMLFVVAMTIFVGCQSHPRAERTDRPPTASRQPAQSAKPSLPPQVEFPDGPPTWLFEVVGDVPGSYFSTWQDTGLVVRQGDTIFIKAESEISYIGDKYKGPDGWRNLNGREGFNPTPLIPGVSFMALVGRVGDSYLDDGRDGSGSGLYGPGFVGTAFVAGPGRATCPPGSGNLFLGVNDSLDDDNSGSFNVHVWVVGRDGELLSDSEVKERVR